MNPRLLFFTKINFGHKQNAGYLSKVRSQSNAFRQSGWDVDLLYVYNNEIRLENPQGVESKSFESRIAQLKYLFLEFPNKVKYGSYKAVYIRHFLTTPLFISFLKRMKPKVENIVMEVPTFPYSFEYKAWNKNKILFLLDQFCTTYFKKYISRIVSFSFDKEIFGIKTISTDNGVDVQSIFFKELPPKFENELHILGLGNPRIWHGYERIINGLNIYYQRNPEINIYFNIVGAGGDLEKYEMLSNQYKLNEKIIFHGYQSGKDLDEICQRCHVAVASLGMHRINVANGEASPLKAREFTARGIPFITGYKDKGFPENWPFLFNCSSDESPVNIEQVLSWYLEIRKNYQDYPKIMRDYAIQNLDWNAKMKPVIDYLNADS